MRYLTLLFSVINIVSILSSLGIGFFVYSRNPHRRKHQLFLLLNLVLAGWALAVFMVPLSGQNTIHILFWVRVSSAVAIFFPAVFYHFQVYTGAGPAGRIERRKVISWYLLSSMLALASFSPLMVSKALLVPFNRTQLLPEVNYGRAFILMALYALGLMGYSICELGRKRKTSQAIQRVEIEYILLGATAGTAFVAMTVFLASSLGASRYNVLGPFSAVIMCGIIAYGIAHYRILEVASVLRSTTVYTLATLLLAVFYSLAVLVFNWIFFYFKPGNSFLPNLLAAVIIAFIFAPVRQHSENLANRLFLRGKPTQPEKLLGEVTGIFTNRLDITRTLPESLRLISDFLGTSRAAVYLREIGSENRFLLFDSFPEASDRLPAELSPDSPLLGKNWPKTVLVKTELERLPVNPVNSRLLEALAATGLEVAVDLALGKERLGLLLLGEKNNGKLYTGQDLNLLQAVTGQLAVFLKNTELFNQLQQAEKLMAVGTLAAGLAHEIRNPLVSIKTFIQLLPEKFHDSEYRQAFSQIASQEVERINNLIQELLNFARPAPINKQPTDLVKIIERSLFLLDPEFRKRSIDIEKRLPAEAFLMGDAEQLHRVFSNLLLNSIQAIDQSGRITVEIIQNPGENRLLVNFKDTGKGIPPENLPRLFDPFYSSRIGGTGLGLSIAHNIVKEHGGRIEVESQPGKGSTFRLDFQT